VPLFKKVIFACVGGLLGACGSIEKGQDVSRGGWEPASSYETPPEGVNPEMGYDADVVKCLKACQQKESEVSPDGQDRLRKCGCTCLEGRAPQQYKKFCHASMGGLLQGSDADTLMDIHSKGLNS